MKALIPLTRASTTRQKDSPATQLAMIQEYATKNSLKLTREIQANESGRKVERDQVMEALELIRLGRASGVIVTRLDRLARDLEELLRIASELDKLNAVLVCTEQKIDTSTPEGRLFFHMMGAFAEFEAELIAARIRDQRAQAREAGMFLGGTRPQYGFSVGADGKLVENISEQETIAQIGYWHKRGMSPQQIADKLTKREGRQWHRTQVVRILDRVK